MSLNNYGYAAFDIPWGPPPPRRPKRQGPKGGKTFFPGDFYDIFGGSNCYNYDDDDHDDVPRVPIKPKPKPPQPDAQTLKVTKCDFNIFTNTRDHHTEEYDITQPPSPDGSDDWEKARLVVRRGQPFDITLHFNRAFDETKDDLRLIFEFGNNGTPIKGTLVDMILSDQDEPGHWGAKIKDKNGNQSTVRIFTPATLYVGEWRFKVDFIQKKKNQEEDKFRFTSKRPIYILFNPWCKEDAVYMDKEDILDECLLKDTGSIYYGNKNLISPRDWNFGQFEGNILLCILYLLTEHEPLKDTLRGDPVHVVRKLSALINNLDDDGVLVGNWSGNYEGGKSPTSWQGSVAIYEQFYATKRPVCYGQCWVFSGLLTTACRALGIVARSVTNFSSAHDTDGSITIDRMCNEDGEKVEISGDSIWNFHVWNDAWMKREDLPSGYDGWQAIDATPQETSSNGIYCCGPSPLTAIKNGDVSVKYDTEFFYAEVNADIVEWMIKGDGELQLLKVKKRSVGQYISTHAPVCDRRDRIDYSQPCWDKEWKNVTDDYKYPEGSTKERFSVKNANRLGSRTCSDVYDSSKDDVEFEFSKIEQKPYGQDFEFELIAKNKSNQNRTVSGCINVNTVKYTGHRHAKVKKQQFKDICLKPGEKKSFMVTVALDEYKDKLAEQCEFEITEKFSVKETQQTSVEDTNFRLGKPEMTLKVTPEGERLRVDMSFTNPLDNTLTGCKISIEGPGLQKPLILPVRDIKPNATWMNYVHLSPRKPGKRKIFVSFDSSQLENVQGRAEIEIKPQSV